LVWAERQANTPAKSAAGTMTLNGSFYMAEVFFFGPRGPEFETAGATMENVPLFSEKRGVTAKRR
jgi:hypothetical protein